MFKADCHIHTIFSPDGHQTPEQLINAAVEAGLTEITVTEHCECNDNGALPPSETPWPDLDVKAYTETYEKLKEKLADSWGIGVSYTWKKKLMVEADFTYQPWSKEKGIFIKVCIIN